jgi:hypothetical protein
MCSALRQSSRRAVLQRDMPYPERLLRETGELDGEVLRFVYDDASIKRHLGSNGRSVASILSAPHLGVVYEGAVDNARSVQGHGLHRLLLRAHFSRSEILV